MAQERKCADCGSVRFVEDRSNGDIVCKGCGLVVEAHIIDERSEWRTFSDKDKDSADPNRVGGPSNDLLEGGGLTTMIGKGRDGDGSYALNRLHARSNNPDRALQEAFKKLGTLCEKLAVTNSNVKQAASEIYKEAVDSGRLKGRNTWAICAACVYLGCRQNSVPRTFKEITGHMPHEVGKKDIGRCFKEVLQLMKDKVHGGLGDGAGGSGGMDGDGVSAAAVMKALAPQAQHPEDYMMRFTSQLRLDEKCKYEVLRACRHTALAAKPKNADTTAQRKPWDGRSPVSIAAAILWIITQLRQNEVGKVSMQEIVTVTNVAEGTIKQTYRDLYPELRKLLPPNFATDAQMAMLPVPETRARLV